jgi:hypothetical protein
MESFVAGLHDGNTPFEVLAWPNETVPCLPVFAIRSIKVGYKMLAIFQNYRKIIEYNYGNP